MKRRIFYLLIAFSLVAAGCMSNNANKPKDDSSSKDAFPVTVKAANGNVTIKAAPKRIVSISPTATEMLFAIKAGSQVVAVDDNSNYPAEASKTALSGFKPNVEAIAGYKPDLVVFSNETGNLTESFKNLKIPAILAPAAKTLDDTYRQIEQLGVATGNRTNAKSVVTGMKAEIAKISFTARRMGRSRTYYHELDNTYFTVTSSTFIGQIYALVGLTNIADAADKDGSGYPQLSGEYIINANPNFIFLADTKCCGESAETVAKRPGWDQLKAVKEGGVVALDDDIASRWGPRVVDLLKVVAEAVKKNP